MKILKYTFYTCLLITGILSLPGIASANPCNGNVCTYTDSSLPSHLTIPAGVTQMEVQVWGAGGGGGGGTKTSNANQNGGGGGGGAYQTTIFSVTPGDVYIVNVGAGGTPGAQNSGGTAGSGGASTISGGPGNFLTASGGAGGANSAGSAALGTNGANGGISGTTANGGVGGRGGRCNVDGSSCAGSDTAYCPWSAYTSGCGSPEAEAGSQPGGGGGGSGVSTGAPGADGQIITTFTSAYVLTGTVVGLGGSLADAPPGTINCDTNPATSSASSCTNTETDTSGSSVTLYEGAYLGYTFSSWGGACSGVPSSSNSCTVTMNADKSVTATFTQNVSYTLTTLVNPTTAWGTITSDVNGINCGSVCSATYSPGTTVTLIPTPAAGYAFSTWSSGGGCSGTGACVVQMTQNQVVQATFVPVYTLTASVSSNAGGTVGSNIGGIVCGSLCSSTYNSGTTVTLTAVTNSGYTLTGWSSTTGASCAEGTQTGNTCTVTMSQNQSVLATFAAAGQYSLTTVLNPSAGGTVVSNSGGIVCGSLCSASYNPNTSVTLTANTNSGYTFSGWSSVTSATCAEGTQTGSTCTVSMSQNQSVTATFTPTGDYPLTIIVSPSGAGTVTTTDRGSSITCTTTCTTNYASGDLPNLTQVAASGYTFSGWSGGGCGVNDNPCVVTMSGPQTVTATYTANTPPPSGPYTLTTTISGGSGTITSADGGINCGSTCSAVYANGTSVTLTANPASGYSFTSWSNACSGTNNTCTVSMSASKTATALFTSSAPSGWILVTGVQCASNCTGGPYGVVNVSPRSNNGISSCTTNSCSLNYSNGVTVTLTAVPSTGDTFSNFNGTNCYRGGSSNPVCSAASASSPTDYAYFNGQALGYTEVKLVGSTDLTSSAPAGALSETERVPTAGYSSAGMTATNPDTTGPYQNVFGDISYIYAAYVPGYDVAIGFCSYTTGGTECSVSDPQFADITSSCTSTYCESQSTAMAGMTEKVVYKYTLAAPVTPPTAPTVTVPSSITQGTSGAYSLVSTDTTGNTLTYNLAFYAGDVSCPDTFIETVPSSGSDASGVSQPFNQTWSITGAGTICADAVDSTGAASAISATFVTVNAPASPPNPPVVTAPSPITENVSGAYSVVSTDPNGYPMDYNLGFYPGSVSCSSAVAMATTPSAGYTSSGVSQPFPYTWSSTGTQTICAQAVDNHSLSSTWSALTVTVQAPSPGGNGSGNGSGNFSTTTIKFNQF